MATINFQEFKVQLQKMKESLESNIINLKNEMESILSESEVLDSVDLASFPIERLHAEPSTRYCLADAKKA